MAGELAMLGFEPYDGGYLYYPSRKSGGKFVTVAEYNRLTADWNRVAGLKGQLKLVGFIFIAITLWDAVSRSFKTPAWAENLFIYGVAAAIGARILWASFAPYRLLKDRDDAVPPRPLSDARRQGRSRITWPVVIVALLLFGRIFVAALNTPDRTFYSWVQLIGSGLVIVMWAWIGFQKFRDPITTPNHSPPD